MILRKVLELVCGVSIFLSKDEIFALLLIAAIAILLLCDVAIAKGGKADSFDNSYFKPVSLKICDYEN
mgnify:CR=1 FL=1